MSVFAHALAEADADIQAEFFNEFFRHLKVISKERHDTQLSYIADRLDSNGREFAESLSQFARFQMMNESRLWTATFNRSPRSALYGGLTAEKNNP